MKSSESEIELDWLQEAQRRVKELDEGIALPVSAEEVWCKAQAILKGSDVRMKFISDSCYSGR